LYRGFPVAFFGSGPAALIYFTTYEVARDAMVPSQQRGGSTSFASSFAAQFAAGMLAEAASCVLFVPIDVIKERMQVQQVQQQQKQLPRPLQPPPPGAPGAGPSTYSSDLYYSSTPDALRKIMRGEGIRGLYRGYWATLASFGPFSAFYFSFYESLKASFATSADPVQIMLCAATAGAAASFVTNPLDIAKLRLQIQRGAAGTAYGYASYPHALASIARQEGVRGLFRGALTRMLFHAPTTAIAMTSFETCKQMVQRVL
jgi:hypothetical protein